jgi:hypothetical protein
MRPAEFAERYRGFAAECWLLAEQQNSDIARLALIELAQSWLDLADCVEKNKILFGLRQEPELQALAR